MPSAGPRSRTLPAFPAGARLAPTGCPYATPDWAGPSLPTCRADKGGKLMAQPQDHDDPNRVYFPRIGGPLFLFSIKLLADAFLLALHIYLVVVVFQEGRWQAMQKPDYP